MNKPLETRRLMEAIASWATTGPHGIRWAGGPGGFSFIQLHTRPQTNEPEVQLTLRAVIVDGQPVIQVPELESSPPPTRADSVAATRGGSAVTMQPIASLASARDADAVCEGCGAVGTVGCAVRTGPSGEALEIHRFCGACWPEQSARYRARWGEEDRVWSDQFFRGRVPARGAGPGMQFGAATWHAALEMVEQIERDMIAPVAPSPQALARLAADLAHQAPHLEGDMPFAIEAFVRRYGVEGPV
jgi:hypothetical protein